MPAISSMLMSQFFRHWLNLFLFKQWKLLVLHNIPSSRVIMGTCVIWMKQNVVLSNIWLIKMFILCIYKTVFCKYTKQSYSDMLL